jgi:hypothetical protein
MPSAAPSVFMPPRGSSILSKAELIRELNVPVHLTDRSDAPLRIAYQRWKAHHAAVNTLTKRLAEGRWPYKMPTAKQMMEMFTSKSNWHQYYVSAFQDLSDFPDMLLWLEQGDDAPSNMEVWGVDKDNFLFKDMDSYQSRMMKRSGKRKEREEKEKEEKGKSHKKKVKVAGGSKPSGSRKRRLS